MRRLETLLLSVLCVAALGTPTSALAGPDGAMRPLTNNPSAQSCPERYHTALQSLRDTVLPAIDAAAEKVREGDHSLPGRWIVEPVEPVRPARDREALHDVAALVDARGRAPWVGRRNEEWIAKRIRTELGDYFEQAPTPYLCDGVEDYLAILAQYVDRLEKRAPAFGDDRQVLLHSARNAFDAARRTMRPMPTPVWAPARPAGGSDAQPASGATPPLLAELRPALDLAGTATAPRVYGPVYDPALPPKGLARDPLALASDKDRVEAVDTLVATALDKGLIEPAPRQSQGPVKRPLLARLRSLAPLVARDGERAIDDPLLRLALRRALNRVEALDYLDHRPEHGSNALVAAFRRSFDAIRAAAEAARAPAPARTADAERSPQNG